jgi:hypothetical protein
MTNLSHGEAGTDASKSRSCAHCGGAIRVDARAHAKYCSTQCRQKASRAGKSVTSVDDDGDEDDAALPPTRRAHVVAGVGVLAVGLALLCGSTRVNEATSGDARSDKKSLLRRGFFLVPEIPDIHRVFHNLTV